MIKNEFKPLTQVDLEDLTDGITKCKGLRFNARDAVKLERNGFVVLYGGDPIFGKLKTLLTQFDVNHIDVETWCIQRKDYVLTVEDKTLIMNSCRYNG
jgi:hypothetical protein